MLFCFRHTDNTLERRNLSEKLKEYTTQKLRQEWAEHEEIFQFDAIDKDKVRINKVHHFIHLKLRDSCFQNFI